MFLFPTMRTAFKGCAFSTTHTDGNAVDVNSAITGNFKWSAKYLASHASSAIRRTPRVEAGQNRALTRLQSLQ